MCSRRCPPFPHNPFSEELVSRRPRTLPCPSNTAQKLNFNFQLKMTRASSLKASLFVYPTTKLIWPSVLKAVISSKFYLFRFIDAVVSLNLLWIKCNPRVFCSLIRTEKTSGWSRYVKYLLILDTGYMSRHFVRVLQMHFFAYYEKLNFASHTLILSVVYLDSVAFVDINIYV